MHNMALSDDDDCVIVGVFVPEADKARTNARPPPAAATRVSPSRRFKSLSPTPPPLAPALPLAPTFAPASNATGCGRTDSTGIGAHTRQPIESDEDEEFVDLTQFLRSAPDTRSTGNSTTAGHVPPRTVSDTTHLRAHRNDAAGASALSSFSISANVSGLTDSDGSDGDLLDPLEEWRSQKAKRSLSGLAVGGVAAKRRRSSEGTALAGGDYHGDGDAYGHGGAADGGAPKRRPRNETTTPEERELAKLAAAREKERLKAVRQLEKEEAAEAKRRERELARIEKHRELERQKIVKAAQKEASRAHKPEEAVKDMTVLIDTALLRDTNFASAVSTALNAVGAQWRGEQAQHPGCLCFQRTKKFFFDDAAPARAPGVARGDVIALEPDVMHRVVAADFAKIANDHVALGELARNLKAAFPGFAVTVVVEGLDRHYHTLKNASTGEFRQAVLRTMGVGGGRDDEQPSRVKNARREIEDALVWLETDGGLFVRKTESVGDTGLLLAMHTKALGMKPFTDLKMLADVFSFEAAAHRRTSNIPIEAWRRQLEQFSGMSEHTAAELSRHFPSPRSLYDAYLARRSQAERIALIAEISVNRAQSGTSRRIGPAMAERLLTLFMSIDGTQMVK